MISHLRGHLILKKVIIGFAVAALALLFTFTPSKASQGKADPGAILKQLDKASKRLDEDLKEFDKTLMKSEVSLLLLGGTKPWPLPDPRLSDTEWVNAIKTAPALSIAQVFKQVKEVDVNLSRTKTLDNTMGKGSDWLLPFVQAVWAQGLKTNRNAEVQLRAGVFLKTYTINSRKGGQFIGSKNAYILRIDLGLELPVRVLRGTQVYHANANLAHFTWSQIMAKPPSKQELIRHIKQSVAQLFKSTAKNQRSPGKSDMWQHWVKKDTTARIKAIQESHVRKHADLSPELNKLPGFSKIKARVGSQRIWEINDIQKPNVLTQHWAKVLAANGISVEMMNGPTLLYDWMLNRYTNDGPLKGVVGASSRVVIYERDCLAVLNDKFIRCHCITFTDCSRTDLALSGKVRKKLLSHFNAQVESVVGLLKKGGARRGVVLHKDTPAIMNYLRPLARTKIPENVLIQTANSIALALEAEPDIPVRYRKEWKVMRNGKPVYALEQVGESMSAGLVPKSIQRAVRRTIDRLVFYDPIAFHAFDNPFSRNRGYTKLPEEYPLRFKRARKGGPGALTGESVLDGEAGTFRIAMLYSSRRPRLGKHRDAIKPYAILNATYNDEKSYPGAACSQMFFWYKAAPPNWKSVLADLPSDQGFKNIGPPVTAAPDTIQEAIALIRQYKAQRKR